MIVQNITVGHIIPTNAYFYIDEISKHGFLIDAGADADILAQHIADNDWVIEKILLTHGHFDHIGAVADLSRNLQIPYYIHEKGQKYLSEPAYNLSAYFGQLLTLNEASYFTAGTEFKLETASDMRLKVLHTPGHTEDSVVFYDAINNLAFCGDTIFRGSVGRTDMAGGNEAALWQSIKNKIFSLPATTKLYSGHTPPTTVGAEKQNLI